MTGKVSLKGYVILAILVVLGVFIIVGVSFGLSAAHQSFDRYQRLANERNQVKVNDIQIAQTQQLVQVEKQKAQIRVVNAQGLADAQRIINSSLTDAYLQYEAIQAQMAMAASPNHTEIYIPVGNDGIPIVRTINPEATPTPGK